MIYITLVSGVGEGDGTPLQYSCLENPLDGGAWWAAVHGVPESWTRLSDFTFTFHFHASQREMAASGPEAYETFPSLEGKVLITGPCGESQNIIFKTTI